MVNIKLLFYGLQNLIQKSRQSSIGFEEPGILPENLKILTSSNSPLVQYFLLKVRTRSLLINIPQRMFGIFLFYLDLELLAKIKKTWFLDTRFLHIY